MTCTTAVNNFFFCRSKLWKTKNTFCYFDLEDGETGTLRKNFGRHYVPALYPYTRTNDASTNGTDLYNDFSCIKIIILPLVLWLLTILVLIVERPLSPLMTKPTKWHVLPGRLRSAWASAQSDQSLCCPHEESLPIEHKVKTDAQTDLSSLGAHPFCWFCHEVAHCTTCWCV